MRGAEPTLSPVLRFIYIRQQKNPCPTGLKRGGILFTGGCVALSGRGDTLLSVSCIIYKALSGLILQFV